MDSNPLGSRRLFLQGWEEYKYRAYASATLSRICLIQRPFRRFVGQLHALASFPTGLLILSRNRLLRF